MISAAVCFVLVLGFAPSLQARKVKITVQFDKQTDFTKFKTYDWMKHDAVARPALAMEIVGAVDQELQARGLTQVKDNPDLLVTYYGGLDTDTNIAAGDPSYSSTGGVPPFNSGVWSAGGGAPGTSSALYVQKGTLVIDVLDASGKKLAWRGMATGNLDTNASKALADIDEAVEKMFAEYPSKKKK